MINNVIIIGRLTEDPVVKVLESGTSVCTVTLAVTRGYKNMGGEYDTDFIKCVLWEGIANNTAEYCKKGSVVGIKGRIASRDSTIYFSKEEDIKKTITVLEVIGERITFF